MGSIEPFKSLVKLMARAFYDDIPMKTKNQPKSGRNDSRGIAVVVLDALTRRQWVREEDLAKDLNLHTKQLRRVLKFFEEEKLINRDDRKETAKGAKIYDAAVAAMGDGQRNGRDRGEKLKMQSYCCLDYAQIYDVVRFRLHRIKKKLKGEDSRNTVQQYICPNCSKRYTALDANRLLSPYDYYFHCESCNGVLEAESDRLAAQELGDGDGNARRSRNKNLEDMRKKMEEQLKPLNDQLERVKNLPIPEFGTLQAWEVRANAAGRGHGDLNSVDTSKSSQRLGFGGIPMPYFGETKVEVILSGLDEKIENVESANTNVPLKILPPWMIKEGMQLTKEQRGETKSTPTALELSRDNKSTTVDEDAKIREAYHAAVLQAMAEKEYEAMNANEINCNSTSIKRQVGVKSKRNVDHDGDDIEWEEDHPTGTTLEHYNVNDLNVEAQACEDDEDDIEWEEG